MKLKNSNCEKTQAQIEIKLKTPIVMKLKTWIVMKFKNSKGNNVLLDSKAQKSSEQTNILCFCPWNCCSILKQQEFGINMRIKVSASPVGAGDAGGAEWAVDVCTRYIWKG